MAPDSATLTTVSGILKEVYLPGIKDSVNGASAIFAELDKSDKGIESTLQGSRAVWAVRLGLTQSVGSRAELVALPAPQRTLVKQTQANLKYLYGTMRLTGPFLESAKSNKVAFETGLKSETDGLKLSTKLDLNRQMWGDGTGLLTLCGVTSATTVIQLATTANMLYFQVGMIVDIRDTNGTLVSNGNSREITAIDVTNKTITLGDGGGNVTTGATDGVYREDAYNVEMTGLSKIVDSSGALFNINPATAGDERWAARENSSFGAFSLDKLQQELDQVNDDSGHWPTHIFSQGGPRRFYLNTLTAERRMAVQNAPTKLNGGFKGLAYTAGGDVDANWVKDRFVPKSDQVFALALRDSEGEPLLQLRRQKDFEFMEVNGSILLPDIYGASGVDAYKAVLCQYAELICLQRNAHLKLAGVTA